MSKNVKRVSNKRYAEKYELLLSGELEKILEELTENSQEENEIEEGNKNHQEENVLEKETKNVQEENKEEKKTNTVLEKYPELKSPDLLKKIISKKSEIEHVYEVMEILDEEAKRIEEEEHRRRLCKEIENNGEKIEEELIKLYEEKNQLNANDDKEKLEEIDKKIEENNAKLKETNKELKDNQKSENTKYNEMTILDLHERYNKVQNKLNRCEWAFANLLSGKSWNEIELNQDSYKNQKFRTKKGFEMRMEQKMKAAREENKDKNQETNKIIEEGKAEKQNKQETQNQAKDSAKTQQNSNNTPVYNVMQRVNNENLRSEQAQDKALMKKEEANEKHFSFGNIVNWIKNTKAAKFVKGVFNRNTVSNVTKADEIEKYKEDLVEEIINAERDEFKTRLKEISNDGINKMAENRMNADRTTQKTNSRSNNENSR